MTQPSDKLTDKPLDLSKEWFDGDTVALNIAPPDTEQYWKRITVPSKRLVLFKQHFVNLFKLAFDDVNTYKLYVEMNDSGRLHFHGTVVIASSKLFYESIAKLKTCQVSKGILRYIMADVRQVCVKPIVDLKKWLQYCKKHKDHEMGFIKVAPSVFKVY